MAWQKGPGEGYREAKADALALTPSLKCECAKYRGRIIGYVVWRDGKRVGAGTLARDAWNAALAKLRQERGLDWKGQALPSTDSAKDVRPSDG